MSDFLVDSNVLIDIATNDPHWGRWSVEHVESANEAGIIHVNPIIYAELVPTFESDAELDHWLDVDRFHRASLPYEAAWLAAKAFQTYRKRGGARTSPMPDFYIGAHADVGGLTLITRDAARYRTYFPKVTLITP